MRAIYFEFAEMRLSANAGNKANQTSCCAYFEGTASMSASWTMKFHLTVKFSMLAIVSNHRSISRLFLKDASCRPDSIRVAWNKKWEFPYLDAASIYAPRYIPELEQFSSRAIGYCIIWNKVI